MLQKTLPEIKPVTTYRGSWLAGQLLALWGWRIHYAGLPGPRGVFAVYPHTSNWDFPVGLLAKWSLGLPLHFWGKDSLFQYPLFGHWLRWVGGIPINRLSKTGKVADTVRVMNASDFFWFGLAPEGTRKRVAGWRSGFYRVACEANVPIGVAYFDYPTKTVSLMDFYMPTGDEAKDIAHMAAVLKGKQGLKPANMSPIQLLDSSVPRDQSLINSRHP